MEYLNENNKNLERSDKVKKISREEFSFVDNRIQQKKNSNLKNAIQRSTVSAYSGERGDDAIYAEANEFHQILGTGSRFHLNMKRELMEVKIRPKTVKDNGTLHLFAHGNPTILGTLKPAELKTIIIDRLLKKPTNIVFHSCFSTGGMDGYDPDRHDPIIAGETARISSVTTKGYSAPIKTISGRDIIGLDTISISMISDTQKEVILQKINSANIKGVFFTGRKDFISLEEFQKEVDAKLPDRQMNILSQLLEGVKVEYDRGGNPIR